MSDQDNVSLNPGESQSESTEKTGWLGRRGFIGALAALFAAANVVVFGIRNKWWAQKLRVVVDGPFEHGTTVPLHIHARRTDWVDPQSLKMKWRDDRVVKAEVKFMFQGAKSRGRRLDLKVSLLDSNQSVIGSKTIACADSRIEGGTSKPFGVATETLSTINSETLVIPVASASLNNVASVAISFSEA
jgi:hypothetical protein